MAETQHHLQVSIDKTSSSPSGEDQGEGYICQHSPHPALAGQALTFTPLRRGSPKGEGILFWTRMIEIRNKFKIQIRHCSNLIYFLSGKRGQPGNLGVIFSFLRRRLISGLGPLSTSPDAFETDV